MSLLRTHLFIAAAVALGSPDVVGGEHVITDSKRMILVPGGTIVNEAGRELSAYSFLISASEVTWGTWSQVRTAADDRGYDIGDRGAGLDPDDPVHSITWYDVIKWCNLRSEIAGRTPAYWVGDHVYREGIKPDVSVKQAADGYRLLTDAEWEFAVRQAEQGVPARSEAAADMSANMWEWCFDLHPGCEADGRVVRGGRQSNLEIHCRIGLRGSYRPDEASDRIGFRVVLPASDD